MYVKNPLLISNIEYIKPHVGDHKLITFNIKATTLPPKNTLRRNWSNYTKDKLLNALAGEQFEIETAHIQDTWNIFENIIINIADQEKVDLIIVGSHGRHGLALLLGSTANSVLHHAKCDVMAVRLIEK